jgi:hypothetical protein
MAYMKCRSARPGISQWVCSAAASLRISTGLQAEIAAPASRPLPGFKDCKVYPEILQRLF